MQVTINPNVLNPLEGKMDQVIDIFVTFFGEKYREQIEHNLKSTVYCFVPKRIKYTDFLDLIENEDNKKFMFGTNEISDLSCEEIFNKSYGQSAEDFFKKEYEKRMQFMIKNIINATQDPETKKSRKKWLDFSDSCLVPIYDDLLNLDEQNRTVNNNLSESQKQRFVELFKGIGYHLGDKYEDYITNPEIRKNLFGEKTIEKHKKITEQIIQSTIKQFPALKYAYDEINKLNIPYKKWMFESILQYAFNNGNKAGFVLGLSTKDKQMQNILCCPWGASCSDDTLLHELGHIVESNLIKYDERKDRIIQKSGFRLHLVATEEENIENEQDEMALRDSNSEERNFSYDQIINEVFHDYFIRYDVIKIAEKKCYKFCLEENNYSGYAYAFPLVQNLINNHKEKIKELMMEPTLDYYDYFGKENFENLGEFLNHYINSIKNNEHYGQFFDDIIAYVESIFGDFNQKGMYNINDINKFLNSHNTSIAEIVAKNNNWSENSLEFVKQFKNFKDIEKRIEDNINNTYQRQ